MGTVTKGLAYLGDSIMNGIASFFGQTETRDRIYNTIMKWVTGKDYQTMDLSDLVDKITNKYQLASNISDKLYNMLAKVSGLKGRGSSTYQKAVNNLEDRIQNKYDEAKKESDRLARLAEKANNANYNFKALSPTQKGLIGDELIKSIENKV